MDRKMEQVSSNLTNISGVFLFRINLPCFGANRIKRMRRSWNKHHRYGGIKITTKKILVLNVETATHFCPSLDFHLTDFGFQDCFDLIQKKLLSPAQYWQQTHLCQPSCLCLTWTRSMQLYMNSKHTNLLDWSAIDCSSLRFKVHMLLFSHIHSQNPDVMFFPNMQNIKTPTKLYSRTILCICSCVWGMYH